ncbi:MAG: Streptomycin 3''-adenylyltransferase [Chlamydiales bacterium]|nr:Streptomycin 3''-adenylyltransferase [Chlamydiales bacterium]MCH9635273.1 Streptomycin 3''-adenylyltransferase [Chlamydiales bacterium]
MQECIEQLSKILGSALLAVYQYGSSIFGGMQLHSDLDLFVVIKSALSNEQQEQLAKALLLLSTPKRPLDVTFVQQSQINAWRYPPQCSFQYGEWLREDFEKGVIKSNFKMPDLAVIVTQLLLKSRTLFGREPDELLAPVPSSDFRKAMVDHIDDLISNLEVDTRNVLLTLARIWSSLETDEIRSKGDAASWAEKRLPEELRCVIERAAAIYLGKAEEQWGDLQVIPCANYMVEQIDKCSNSSNPIRLSE